MTAISPSRDFAGVRQRVVLGAKRTPTSMRHAKLYGFTILSIDIVPKLFSYEVPTRLLEERLRAGHP